MASFFVYEIAVLVRTSKFLVRHSKIRWNREKDANISNQTVSYESIWTQISDDIVLESCCKTANSGSNYEKITRM